MAVDDVTIDDVEKLSKTGWTQMSDAKKTEMLEIAKRRVQQQYSGKVSTISETEGDLEDFTKWIAAHHWELAEGGEAQSESATGGSVNYNTVTGETHSDLSSTRYGRVAREYLRDETSIGLVRTH